MKKLMKGWSMKTMRDFLCKSCEEVTERFIDSEVTHIQCHCGGNATKVLSAPQVSLEGISGAFPDAHHKWAKIREDNARIKAKQNS